MRWLVLIVAACQHDPSPPPPTAKDPPPAATPPKPTVADAAVAVDAVAAAIDAAVTLPHVNDASYPVPDCPPVATLDALQKCIVDQGFASHADEVGGSAVADVRLLYVHEDVFIAAARDGKWRLIDLLKHVQDHGHRHASIDVKRIRDVRSGRARVTEITFHYDEDTVDASGSDEPHVAYDKTVKCTWTGTSIDCDPDPW